MHNAKAGVRATNAKQFATRLLCSTALALLAPAVAEANPQGGQVAAGTASIASSNANTVTISQTSAKAVINWQSFSIAPGETTRFVQPSASSIALNRVTSINPSSILGNLNANGQVWLINPNGIVFGKTASVDVAGLLATTIDITDSNFMSGTYRFDGLANPSAMVLNAGQITVRNAGLAALVAPGVENSGVIQANLGQIQLSSTAAFTVDLYGDGLFNFALDKQATQAIRRPDGSQLPAAISNSGALIADGGRILLTTNAASSVVSNAINMSGYAQATTATVANGTITLDGGGSGAVDVSGTLNASGPGAAQTGGAVQITGNSVALDSTAKIDVSGTSGGGTVLVGGDMHGTGSLRDASTTTIAQGATINADATSTGNGGTVVVWSNDQTAFNGAISARGGASGGDGGTSEVSGHALLGFNGTVDLRATNGQIGTLLLDPENLTIEAGGETPALPASSNGTVTLSAQADNSTLAVSTIELALALANVTLSTGATGSQAGDITVLSNISWSTGNTLTLSAYRNISVDAIIANTGGASIILRADNTGTGIGTVVFANGSTLSTSGDVSIFYNPSVNPAGSVVNSTSYVNSAENFAGDVAGGGALSAYMLVNSVYDLQNIQNNLSGSYALGRDIDAAGISNFVPIGSGQEHYLPDAWLSTYTLGGPNTPFVGILDGEGHTIDSLTISVLQLQNQSPYTSTLTTNVGLFGDIGPGGIVSNLGLTNVQVTGTSTSTLAVYNGTMKVGALVGTNDGTIIAAYVSGTVSGVGADYVGGLVGYNDGTIKNSHSSATVTGTAMDYSLTAGVGGLVGDNGLYWQQGSNLIFQVGLISRSYATGTVNGAGVVYGNPDGPTGLAIGGLVGVNDANVFCLSNLLPCTGATVDQSFATGAVNGGGFFGSGGLVGYNDGLISRSYATGSVTNVSTSQWNAVGALVGMENDPDVCNFTAGSCIGNTTGSIVQSYAVGRVTGGDANPDWPPQLAVGGLVGLFGGGIGTADATILSSYWDVQMTGQSVSGSQFWAFWNTGGQYQGAWNGPDTFDSGVGMTTTQLQSSSLPAGFDSVIWVASAGAYPELRWQMAPSATTVTSPIPTVDIAPIMQQVEQLAILQNPPPVVATPSQNASALPVSYPSPTQSEVGTSSTTSTPTNPTLKSIAATKAPSSIASSVGSTSGGLIYVAVAGTNVPVYLQQEDLNQADSANYYEDCVATVYAMIGSIEATVRDGKQSTFFASTYANPSNSYNATRYPAESATPQAGAPIVKLVGMTTPVASGSVNSNYSPAGLPNPVFANNPIQSYSQSTGIAVIAGVFPSASFLNGTSKIDAQILHVMLGVGVATINGASYVEALDPATGAELAISMSGTSMGTVAGQITMSSSGQASLSPISGLTDAAQVEHFVCSGFAPIDMSSGS